MSMALTFVTGPAGSGKTEWIYKKILETAKADPERMVLVVVPEQFSLQTMQDILVRSETKSMSNIEVLSFLRLSYRIFEELGVETGQLLSDLGKSLILKRVLNRVSGELRLFASNTKKAGFLDELKSLISEFYQYGITPEAVTRMAAEETDPVLSRKLSEIALMFDGFSAAIEGKYLPTETVSDRLAGVIDDSAVLTECTVFLDGFTGFTPSQYGLLTKLFAKAKECYLTLTMDEEDKTGAEHGLFYLTKHTKEIVTGLAQTAGCEVSVIRLPENGNLPRFAEARAMEALEKGLFRYRLPQKLSCEGCVTAYAVRSRNEEAALIAADLARRVRTEGLRYRQAAVITGDIDGYGEILLEEFQKAGIPAFLDKKRKILHNPCITLLRAVLQIALNNYSFDSVFRYLKSSLTDFAEEDIAKLENYCLACGIRGENSWKREWKYRYRTRRKLETERLNELREKVYESLSETTKALLKEPTAGGKTRALYDFLAKSGAEEKLLAVSQRFEETNDTVRAGEYRQIYRNIIELFDRMVELLDTEEVSLREYIELLETGFRECKIGLVPSSLDSVVIGDLMRTRLSEIEVLYLAGANEGVTPQTAGSGGLISETERESLKERKIALAPGKKEATYTEQFYLYSVLTKPKKRLVLTVSRMSAEGAALQPSWFIKKISGLFTDFEIKEEESLALISLLKNDGGRACLLDGIRRLAAGETIEDPKFWELYRQEAMKNGEQLNALLHTAFVGNSTGTLNEITAKRLYGAVLYGSVTRMEKYAACAFAHFVQYGLALEERAEYKITAPELGNLYHAALEFFAKKLRERGRSWHGLTEEERDVLCDESLADAVAAVENQVFSGSERNRYLVKKAKRILLKAVTVLQQQVQGSLFEPEHCEAGFEHSSKFFALHGKIDRYDVCESDGKWYLRVIDYKSGSKTFDLNELYYGLQVQLEVYLAAAKQLAEKERGQEMQTAGAFYFHLGDPFLPRDKYSEDEVLKKLRPDGIINMAPSVVAALDTEFHQENGGLRPDIKSKLIHAETDKEGLLKGSVTATDTEGFEKLIAFAYKKLEEEAAEIYHGAAGVNPYRKGKKTACEFCNYRQICGFDNRLTEYSYRNLPELLETEIWNKIREV